MSSRFVFSLSFLLFQTIRTLFTLLIRIDLFILYLSECRKELSYRLTNIISALLVLFIDQQSQNISISQVAFYTNACLSTDIVQSSINKNSNEAYPVKAASFLFLFISLQTSRNIILIMLSTHSNTKNYMLTKITLQQTELKILDGIHNSMYASHNE